MGNHPSNSYIIKMKNKTDGNMGIWIVGRVLQWWSIIHKYMMELNPVASVVDVFLNQTKMYCIRMQSWLDVARANFRKAKLG